MTFVQTLQNKVGEKANDHTTILSASLVLKIKMRLREHFIHQN